MDGADGSWLKELKDLKDCKWLKDRHLGPGRFHMPTICLPYAYTLARTERSSIPKAGIAILAYNCRPGN